MNKSNIFQRAEERSLIISLVASVLVTLFLFYIDEGYYSFAWMLSAGSWIIFAIYVTGLFCGQQIILKVMPARYPDKLRRIVSLILGLPLGLTVLFVMFSARIGD